MGDGRGYLFACRSVSVSVLSAAGALGGALIGSRGFVRTVYEGSAERDLAERGLRVRAFGRGVAEAICGE